MGTGASSPLTRSVDPVTNTQSNSFAKKIIVRPTVVRAFSLPESTKSVDDTNGHIDRNEVEQTLQDNALDDTNELSESYIPLSDGKHKWKFPNGDIYYGMIKDNMMHGRGTLNMVERRAIYEGEFMHNMYSGQGVYIHHTGDTYKGGFEYGVKHGIGVMYYTSSGLSIKGIWTKGKRTQVLNKPAGSSPTHR